MGLVKNLASINKHIDAEEAKFSGSDRPATKWFKLADKQAAKVVFLQELDEDSPNSSSKNGLGALAVEHVNPKNWRRKAVCSYDDEGACWACEQHAKDFKAGWRQKTKLYINVLVDDGVNEPYVAILSQGVSGKMITPTLLEYAVDDGTITDKVFTIKRSGSGLSDTSYTIRAGKEHNYNVEEYEVTQIEDVVRQVPYDEQEAFYRQDEEADAEVAAPSVSAAPAMSSTSTDSEW